MSIIDTWQEIESVISKNKLRTFLTAFSVAWGIFMLIILLGSGNGLQNAMTQNMGKDNTFIMWFSQGHTSMAYNGLPSNRRIYFYTSDLEYLDKNFPEIQNISGRFYLPGGSRSISYKQENGVYQIQACSPSYQIVDRINITEGRFINNFDVKENRKTAVLGYDIALKLFKDQSSIGKYVNISGSMFEVVGVFRDPNPYKNKRIYIPISTTQIIFNGQNRINIIAFTIEGLTIEQTKILEESVLKYLARVRNFNPDDKRAVYVRNTLEDYERSMILFGGIKIFIWIIGIGTIIAGIMGVSNIMLISVRERTKEFGIRKAIGASPSSIVGLVISEAIIITTTAGYIGMMAGIGVLEIVNHFLVKASEAKALTNNQNFEVFSNPSVDISVALSATALLIISGTLAGYFPARKAAAIRPIEALRDE